MPLPINHPALQRELQFKGIAKPLHDLCLAFPWLNSDDLKRLQEDIQANGQHQPILTVDGAIVDGKNRELACLIAGVTPQYQEWAGTGSLVSIIMSLNWQRRHLNESQRADIAARLIPALAEELKTKKATNSRKFTKSVKTEAKEKAAELMNVSPRTVDSALVVETHGTPEIKAAVSAGDLSVSAAVKEIKKTTLDQVEPPAPLQDTQDVQIKGEKKSDLILDRQKLESFGHFVVTQLVKIEERAAHLNEPLQERLHELFTAPEWNEDTVSAVSLVYEQWLAVLRTEKSHLYHKERKLLATIKWVEKVAQEMRDAQTPLLKIFARPPEPDTSTAIWKPKAITQIEMGTKLPKTKPVKKSEKREPSAEKAG